MRKILMSIALAGASLTFSAAASAATVVDASGDFLKGFIGPNSGDLDVTSFSVNYNSVAASFTLSATMAAAIDPSVVGFYVIGANTGTGLIAPFASLGQGNVIFNQAIVVNKNGTGNVGATQLDPKTISISGDTFSVDVPLSLLPSTGFTPEQYGFNLWPRVGTGNNNQISDFSPENATLAAGAPVPEPATWALLLAGFGATGLMMRRRATSMALSFS